jgi:histidine ammonia-lyase
MLGMLVMAIADLDALVKVADIGAAMSIEALLGTDRVHAADLQALRPHPGQAASARNITRLLEGSGWWPRTAAGTQGPGRVLSALRSAGRGCGARHARSRPDRRRA